jgi:beta-lactamase regulating signal transducer with metallopeptidase domain
MLELLPLATPTADRLISWFAETTLVASALAVVAMLLGRVRRIGPAVRHVLWLVVLVKLVTPPLVHWPWSRPWSLDPQQTVRRVTPPAPAPTQPSHPASISPAFMKMITALSGRPTPASGPRAEEQTDAVVETGLHAGPGLGVWVVGAWLVGSVVAGILQARRILRFRRLLHRSTPAPQWLIEEAERIGRRIGVRVPAIRVVDRPGTPLLWCLGRPALIVPAGLVESLEAARWPGILAHELAHLRRGDPWVSRLELVAGLAWWWCPLYWLARRRLDVEAEIACDAWVLWALPDDRLSYAESLIRICTSLSSARSPEPALGVAGTGRSFERRLMMILRERVSHHVSAPGLLAATLLALLSAPSWTLAHPARAEVARASFEANAPGPEVASILAGRTATGTVDADDDAPKPAKKATAAKAKKAETKVKSPKADEPADRKAAAKEAFGPDFEKKMEALGEKIAKEMEGKFGPGSDFVKKMEAFGKDMEGKFGPDFEKKMEAFGKDMEGKFGPDFEKKMEAMAKEIESKFGPEFEKKIEAMAKEIESKFGPEFEKKIEAMAKEAAGKFSSDVADKIKTSDKPTPKTKAATPEKPAAPKGKTPATAKAKTAASRRAERIEALESRIDDLLKELKQLKDEEDR